MNDNRELGIHASTLGTCHHAHDLLNYLSGYIGAASHSSEGLSQEHCKELVALIDRWLEANDS